MPLPRRRRRAPEIGSPAFARWAHRTANAISRLVEQALPAGLVPEDSAVFATRTIGIAAGRTLGWAATLCELTPIAQKMMDEALSAGVADFAQYLRQSRTRQARHLAAGLDALARRLAGPPPRGRPRPWLTVVK
jgi:hypothetical protein